MICKNYLNLGNMCCKNFRNIKTNYKASILTFPDPEYIQQIKKKNFLWNKHDKIKRDIVIGGGGRGRFS